MKTLIPSLALIYLLFSLDCVFAAPLYSPSDPTKPTTHLRTNEAYDSREGGETIEDAIEIELPFYDTGMTCDNVDDYDEACPYANSTSPDVVYTFVSSEMTDVKIDLCGSLYDTKVYLYDEFMNLIACNDDYYTSSSLTGTAAIAANISSLSKTVVCLRLVSMPFAPKMGS